jgi:hypothetical protein
MGKVNNSLNTFREFRAVLVLKSWVSHQNASLKSSLVWGSQIHQNLQVFDGKKRQTVTEKGQF